MTIESRKSGTDHFDATYGAAAHNLKDKMSFLLHSRSGVHVEGWDTAIHTGGLVALLPIAAPCNDQAKLDSVDPTSAFASAAEQAFEAFSADYELEDADALPALLLKSAESARQLAGSM
ncbi:hypothetical protein QO021_29970 (plasmid) [Pseudomonas amygdali pv. lachrymans]|uniref:Uncharacterized protein n=1 Tax=Pseudomonas syringae pv. maculicola str. ES4326 TaxID=629265 RepID=A0A8T8CB05_PSEYM|nr:MULTISPECIES: hypothetical protein [Pseudomonas syringae group]QHF00458.1 hypothetical protein PMA4326_028490 [Pseudomonas syringae pv. maculicola str. ES4326]RMM39482.1 hypothetical protein ALQ79_200129 [Pseudomonas amygdali pv. lachrymans]UBZ00436.1 hypothetical protein LCG56_29145 [Pseudomonas cannabina pv. alisalensis]WIO61316.1 hypothetical protein QO021_29970 [Pseudomonas amygdali pv. lachrymans]